jgi:hypothetical protein
MQIFVTPTESLPASSTLIRSTVTAPPATPTHSPANVRSFKDSFDTETVLEESDRMDHSASPDWWLNSGGWFLQHGGVASTWIGDAPAASKWRGLYNQSNPADTDGGAHPQNLFRLITRSEWLNPSQRAFFRIRNDRLSAGPNRNGSNGLLLMGRYADGNNLYYAGIRVDGFAVIKKKSAGLYATLAETRIYPGSYDRTYNPNLIPHDTWIGLGMELRGTTSRTVIILWLYDERSGEWNPILRTEDEPSADSPLIRAGFAGIRTDFMDVEFDDYSVEEAAAFN